MTPDDPGSPSLSGSGEMADEGSAFEMGCDGCGQRLHSRPDAAGIAEARSFLDQHLDCQPW